MIKFENVEVVGWKAAICGMRNPKNSWAKSDSEFKLESFIIGPNDLELMLKLAKAGSTHAKYRRMIVVYADITAPLYWWKEFDTYKVGTVANSCSTMHKITEKEFVVEDFSNEHVIRDWVTDGNDKAFFFDDDKSIAEDEHYAYSPFDGLRLIIALLNTNRDAYLETKDKKYWWQMIQLLPTSYNQRRTIMFNYEVLSKMFYERNPHKLDEWIDCCKWIKTLPYSEIIIGEKGEEK